LVALGLLMAAASDNAILHQTSQTLPGRDGWNNPESVVVVSEPFEVKRRSNLEIALESDVNNNWLFLSGALINEAANEVRTFGAELSHYQGFDSDGSWAEGDRTRVVYLGNVAPGTYLLRMQPEVDRGSYPRTYGVTVRSDVFIFSHWWLVLFLLWLPPVLRLISHGRFEAKRWAESDHA
jgi:hypothetical protein